MPGPDWRVRSATRLYESPSLHVRPLQHDDGIHQSRDRHVHGPEGLLRLGRGHNTVDRGGRNPNLFPLSHGGLARKDIWDGTIEAEPRGGPYQLDEANDEQEPRLSPTGHDASLTEKSLQQVVGSEPSLPLPQADPAIHPARAGYLHQSLINRITERLRDEAGLSPEAIADLLVRGAHLLPPLPPQQHPDPRLRDQANPSVPPAHPVLSASLAPQTTPGLVPKPTKIDTVLDPGKEAADPLKAEAEAVLPAPRKMSPGILIPRNAGIRLRGVEQEPPLVDAPAPDKSKIVVASQYLFQHDLEAAGMMDERDVQGRLQGIQVIEAGRRGLRM